LWTGGGEKTIYIVIMSALTDEAMQAKARRRKSLAHAMKLVDSAIANLEVVSVAPHVSGQGGGDPAVTYRRRRSTISAGRRTSFDGTSSSSQNPLQGLNRARSQSALTAHSMLHQLASRCNGQDTTLISISEIEQLRESLNETNGEPKVPGSKDSGRAPFTEASAWSRKLSSHPPNIPNIKSWSFDVFHVTSYLLKYTYTLATYTP